MKKFTQKLFATCLLLTALLSGLNTKAQTPNIHVTFPYCSNGLGITAWITPGMPGATSYSWNVIGVTSSTQTTAMCLPTQTTLSSDNDSIFLDFPCPGMGTFTIVCEGYNSSNTLLGTITQTFVPTTPPGIGISSSPSYTAGVCMGAPVTVTAWGAVSYTWSNGSNNISTTYNPYPSVSSITVVGTTSAGCTAQAVYMQPTFIYPNINISGPSNGNVCQGSSTTLTASGLSSYSWTGTGVTTPTLSINVTGLCQQYTVTGNDVNGCAGTMTAHICVDTTCAYVWPGDANSDGLVDNTDALEIGLAYLETGPSRSPGGNLFSSQFATASGWTGFGSTGKRKVHVDCNGDGTIDMGDTVAIYNNYSLTHSFKPSESSNTPDISLLVSSVQQGGWNKADIILGSSSTPISQLYGLAFDINFDNTLIETNSAYITYSSSFLNASTTNVQFRKTNFTNGKVYGASVRTNGTEVNGNGKIGEFWFKVKDNVAGTAIHLSTSNSQKIGKSGVKLPLAGGSISPVIEAKTVGLNEINLYSSVSYFPNPASTEVTLTSGTTVEISYGIVDILGREVKNGTFSNTTKLDVSTLQNGSYLIRLSAGSEVTYKKLVIDK
ncbi:hypothetical protein CNR22_06445 [Sphingobacteriaceae bacterium]|nr:hypothetical protein CNR22_06445 [Sphingobacteriaceae bacterium]